MTLTFENDLDSVNMNQRAKYVGRRSFSLKVIVRKQTHTHGTDCSTWTTKVVGIMQFVHKLSSTQHIENRKN